MKAFPCSLEDKARLEDAVLDYLYAVDGLKDIDFMMSCFTDDATLDLSGLDMGVYEGPDAIKGFYEEVFKTMTHHMHMMTNFRVTGISGSDASCHSYICGMGRSVTGVDVQVYVYYDLKLRLTEDGWKIRHFYEAPQLPMPASVLEAHSHAAG